MSMKILGKRNRLAGSFFGLFDYSIFLSKKSEIEICGFIYDFFLSYVVDPKTCMTVTGTCYSSLGAINDSVSQGSILEQVLFLSLKLNQLSNGIHWNLYFGQFFVFIQFLGSIIEWFAGNSLVLNANETESIRFKNFNTVSNQSLYGKCNGKSVLGKGCVRFLELQVVSSLKIVDHCFCVERMLSSAFFGMRNLRSMCNHCKFS